MKTYVRLLSLSSLALVAFSPFVRADEPSAPPPAPSHEHRAHEWREHRMRRLDEKLHLTADQKTKIEAIWDAAEQKAQQQGDDAAEDRRERRRALMRETHAQVRAVLTPDQQKIFDDMKPERGHRSGDGDHDAN